MFIAGRGVQNLAGGELITLFNIIISGLFSMRHRSLYISGTASPRVESRRNRRSRHLGRGVTLCLLAVVFLNQFPRLGSCVLRPCAVPGPTQSATKLRDGLKAVEWFGIVFILVVICFSFWAATRAE